MILSMLRGVSPRDYLHRQLAGHPQDGNLRIGVGDDDADCGDEDDFPANKALGNQSVAGYATQHFDAAYARNEKFRHDSRQNKRSHGIPRTPGLVEFYRANPSLKHRPKSSASNLLSDYYNHTSLLRRLGKQTVSRAES